MNTLLRSWLGLRFNSLRRSHGTNRLGNIHSLLDLLLQLFIELGQPIVGRSTLIILLLQTFDLGLQRYNLVVLSLRLDHPLLLPRLRFPGLRLL